MKNLILPILSLLILSAYADARSWTRKEGRTFEGQLVKVYDKTVSIRRKFDHRKFTMDIAELSQEDQSYLAQLKGKKEEPKPTAPITKPPQKNKSDLAKLEKKKKPQKKTIDKKPLGKLPKTKEELEKWIIGTEWRMRNERGNEKISRFHEHELMGQQIGKRRWNKDKPSNSRSYTVLTANTIKFGVGDCLATFSKDFKRMKSIDAKGINGTGEIVGRF